MLSCLDGFRWWQLSGYGSVRNWAVGSLFSVEFVGGLCILQVAGSLFFGFRGSFVARVCSLIFVVVVVVLARGCIVVVFMTVSVCVVMTSLLGLFDDMALVRGVLFDAFV